MINRFANRSSQLILIIVAVLLIQSCDKVPTADFTYEPASGIVAGDTVFFTNESIDASSYEWDFGNGMSSTEESPYMIYEDAAYYNVVLNAFSKAGSDTVSRVVDINFPTVLGFFVYEPDSVSLLTGCNVWVYDNEEDFNNFVEPLDSAITDQDGIAVFENLEDIAYYAMLFKETADGLYISGGVTNPLELYAINLYAVVMEYYPGGGLESVKKNSAKKSTTIFSPIDNDKKEFIKL